PANVLLAPDGTPKITDFGLAKSADNDSHLTATGQVLGTPSYMAPEQATGRQDLVGPATDVYSIGAVLYHCLTGRPPFQADNIVDTLNQVRHNEPVAPRVFNQKLPLDIEAICLKCLEKSAVRRFAAAAELAEELGRFERGEPVTTRPVGRATQLWRAVRRNKTQFAAASLAVLALLALAFGAATVVLTRLYREAEQARRDAGRERVTAQFMKSRAEDSEQKTRQVLYTTDIARARMHYERTEPAAMRAALLRQQPSGGAATQVGFEWYYLWRMAHQARHVLAGHGEPAVVVAFSRDGKQLFSGEQSPTYARPGVVRRWTLEAQAEASTSPSRSPPSSSRSAARDLGSPEGATPTPASTESS
ncbi:MAG TPA: serine/threonine-protein kinase, partial [Pirellulaceae bacterium]|nr:serine/threonine-protein kinase [Pirellulaceae bacterium]